MATLTAPAYGKATKTKPNLPFIIAASSGGTLIEWYDFYLYGVLAGFFATHFFPGDMKAGFLYSAQLSSVIWAILSGANTLSC
jgi:hypothetical protein